MPTILVCSCVSVTHEKGIEVYGVETAFDGGFDGTLFQPTTLTCCQDECGIYIQKPKSIPKGVEWNYKETVLLGYTTKTKEEVRSKRFTFLPNSSRKSFKTCNLCGPEMLIIFLQTIVTTSQTLSQTSFLDMVSRFDSQVIYCRNSWLGK